ncbi:MAG: hypothetical protein KF746_27650 [Chitinophagaceae bacterium]|nr:hypothetical protein [Chitinophagaceae bacterium]
MKMIFLITACLVYNFLHSQDCKSFYFFQNNKAIELGIFNKRGDPTGMVSYKISNVNTKGAVTTASVKAEVFDKTRKAISSSVNSIKCENGAFMADMKLFLPQQQSEQFNKTEVKTKNGYLEYPAVMKPGDRLKDGNFEMEADNNGLKQTLKIEISNRNVTGTEKVTTPAGTWDCLVITYHTMLNIQTGPIAIPLTFESTEWFAPAFGVVKTVNQAGTMEVISIK